MKREDYLKSCQMTVACEWCKSPVTRTRSQICDSNRNYCNKECQHNDFGKDLRASVGKPFGERLVVLEILPMTPGVKRRYVLCQCKCGNKAKLEWVKVKSGRVVSCGCYAKQGTLGRFYKNLDALDSR